jgi:hypothetical protein
MTESILRTNPDSRDSDSKLIALYMHKELTKMGHDLKAITGVDFLGLMYNGKLPSSEAITRARRKLQELHIDLRGKTYEQRHREVRAVKKDLGYGY